MQLLFAIIALFVVCSSGQQDIGYWFWTWSSGGGAPGGTNAGIAFSGWTNPSSAISDSNAIKNRLPGTKYISLGGGNANGRWTAALINQVNSAIEAGNFAGYGGIAYDIEEGDAGLTGGFQNSFRAAKGKGLRVIVSISHSAPYGFSDAYALMQAFFADANIDLLSPQLYTSGTESQNDYTTSGGVSWDMYARSRARDVPSNVRGSYYSSALTYFRQHGFNITGYKQRAK